MPETTTVLIVEDDFVLSNTLKDACTAEGFTVITAADGEEGLRSALENKPQVILLDINMPKMDGLQVLENLNSQSPDPKRKVFMFTNLSDMEKISTALQNGASGYFVKAQTSLADILQKIKST